MLHVRWKVGSESLLPSLNSSSRIRGAIRCLEIRSAADTKDSPLKILSAKYNVMLVQLLNPEH
jgi:hypothetical protein